MILKQKIQRTGVKSTKENYDLWWNDDIWSLTPHIELPKLSPATSFPCVELTSHPSPPSQFYSPTNWWIHVSSSRQWHSYCKARLWMSYKRWFVTPSMSCHLFKLQLVVGTALHNYHLSRLACLWGGRKSRSTSHTILRKQIEPQLGDALSKWKEFIWRKRKFF